ncbi:hypothetical protein V8B97DRAFT_1915926 [Scleroderma yunnanense]
MALVQHVAFLLLSYSLLSSMLPFCYRLTQFVHVASLLLSHSVRAHHLSAIISMSPFCYRLHVTFLLLSSHCLSAIVLPVSLSSTAPASRWPQSKKMQEKHSQTFLQDCQELYGDHNNALKVLEEHAGIHYKPVVQSTLKRFDQIKDAYLTWAGYMFHEDSEVAARRLHFGAPFPDVKEIKTFYDLVAKKGNSRLGATGMSHKSLKTFHRQFLSMWHRNTGEKVPSKDAEQLMNHATVLALHYNQGQRTGAMVEGHGYEGTSHTLMWKASPNVFFWIISNSEGGPDVQVVLQWEFNKNMHLSEAKRTSSNISTLALEQVDMDGVLSLLALADHYSACEEKFMDLFEHPEKISKFPYKVEVKKSIAAQPVFRLTDEKTPVTYNTVNNTLRRLGRQLGWKNKIPEHHFKYLLGHTMNSEHGKTTYQSMYRGVDLSAIRFGHASDTWVMKLMSSISQGKDPISGPADRVLAMLEANIEMHTLVEAHAKALEAIAAKYPQYLYDPRTITVEDSSEPLMQAEHELRTDILAHYQYVVNKVMSGLDMKAIDTEEVEVHEIHGGKPFKWDQGVDNCIAMAVNSFSLLEWANHLMDHGYPILTTGDGSESSNNSLQFPPNFKPSQVMYHTEAAGFSHGAGTPAIGVCIVDYGSKKQREAREQRGEEAGANGGMLALGWAIQAVVTAMLSNLVSVMGGSSGHAAQHPVPVMVAVVVLVLNAAIVQVMAVVVTPSAVGRPGGGVQCWTNCLGLDIHGGGLAAEMPPYPKPTQMTRAGCVEGSGKTKGGGGKTVDSSGGTASSSSTDSTRGEWPRERELGRNQHSVAFQIRQQGRRVPLQQHQQLWLAL